MVVVQDGPRWWARDQRGKVSTNRGRDTSRWGHWPGLELTRGRELLGAARLGEHKGEAVIAGRRAALLWALPTGEGTRWWHFSGPSEVAVDAERAVVLRAPGLEVAEIVFDEDLAPELFAPLTGRSALGRRRRPPEPVPLPPASPVPRIAPGDASAPGGLRAEAIEALHTSEGRWSTLVVAGREWHDTALEGTAFTQATSPARGWTGYTPLEAAPGTPEPPPPPAEVGRRWGIWIAGPDQGHPERRERTEFVVGVPGHDEAVECVWVGATWWSRSPTRGEMTNDGNPSVGHGSGPGVELVGVAALPAALDIVEAERSSFLGRAVLKLRAIPALQDDEESLGAHGLGAGAHDYELLVDAERGVLLRSEARLAGRAFRVVEVTSISFDGEVEDGVFKL